jgi:TonB family protein
LHAGSARPMRDIMRRDHMEYIANAVHNVYDKYFHLDDNLKGTIVIKFTISHDGFVVNDTILSSTTENKEFDDEIINALRKRRWKKIKSGKATLTFPFTFWRNTHDYYRSKKSKTTEDLCSSLNPYYDESYTIYWRNKMSRVTFEINSIKLKAADTSSNKASRLKQQIESSFYDNFRSFDGLYWKLYLEDESFKLSSDLSGKITLRFIIAPSGNITDIFIVSSTTDYPEFDNKFKGLVSKRIMEEVGATVTVTFNFRNIDDGRCKTAPNWRYNYYFERRSWNTSY